MAWPACAGGPRRHRRDVFEARVSTPPITTVALPGNEQAARALEVLSAMAAGQRPAEVTRMPGRLVIGQSCGCASHQVEAAGSGMVSQRGGFYPVGSLAAAWRSVGLFSRSRAVAAMTRAVRAQLKPGQEVHEAMLKSIAMKLIDGYCAETGWGCQAGAFADALQGANLMMHGA